MRNKGILFISVMSCACNGITQTDSVVTLEELRVNAYPSKPRLLNTASSAAVVSGEQIRDYTNQSLVPVMNSVPGVRMEERSPGSYRLSIRGSLLRSPFGIRNVKIYLDEFPLTDAGGNTYLNILHANTIRSIQIIKGPDGSMFGANTGGVILLGTGEKDSARANIALKTGSYGLLDQQLSFRKHWKHYSLSADQAYQQSEGYRENSALRRKYLQLVQKWNYHKGEVKVLALGSQLHYETPGGLTSAQAEEDPGQARAATAVLPGASEQKAGVYNSLIFAGISNEHRFSAVFKHVIAVFGCYSDFKNPFITNFETRKEQSVGVRSFVEWGNNGAIVDWKWDLGLEWQQTKSRVSNYENDWGERGELQASDDLKVAQNFAFSQFSVLIYNRLGIEAALSLNKYQYRFRNLFPDAEEGTSRKQLDPQWMPRAGISYRIVNRLVWRASLSKGYSPPTLAEIRPSDNTIYSGLQSEYGWNYETGFRFSSFNQRWYADAVIFKFDLQRAIVRRVTNNGVEYFVNAGGTNQQGLEVQFAGVLLKHRKQGIIRGVNLYSGFTWYDFSFAEYVNDQDSFTGNRLTGVPDFVTASSLKVVFPQGISLFLSYNYTDRIPLNDENSANADPYQLLGAKFSLEHRFKNKLYFQFYCGVENILNVEYSLGNDLNAAGERYYNPAPGRTSFVGIRLGI